jgi:BirA family transcriptional regulator, biotin operon repressor / biotin---[acetyl-CoA-carboxylase] ligase
MPPLNVATIRLRRPRTPLHYWASTPSTMIEAARLAAAGAPHGTIAMADEQTAGVGRFGRSWLSEAETGIYCSILLRLSLAPASLPVASLLLGLATAEAIEKSTQLVCDLRWPNDVLIGERKVAGILPQLVENCIIAGIGINVNQSAFDAGLRTPATSLRIESRGRLQSREDLIVNLLESIDVFCSMLESEGAASILRAFMSASSYALNRRVIIEENGLRGTTSGLDDNGFLLIRYDSGQIQRLAAGGVRPDHSFA